MAPKRLNEGYTEFAPISNPWIYPIGVVGRFFSKFFGRGSKEGLDTEQEDLVDPKEAKKPQQPLHGDTIKSKDVVRLGGIYSSKNRHVILPEQEYDRKKRYREYEDMDGYPEIGSAFDVYADDCTQENLDGSKWDIRTDDDLIKDEVKQLFETIELDTNLWDIVRNTVKYGDNFLELVVDVNDIKKGIQRIKILNPNFIYRIEDEFGYLENFIQEIPAKDEWTTYGGLGTNIESNSIVPLDPGQIVHFRLRTSDPLHYPYGKSIAGSARSIYRKLKMMEDAMLIYRLSRAPERRIFYIDTGSLPSAKADAHIKLQMSRLKKNKIFNSNTGNIDEAFNVMAADEDFYIAVNGNSGTKIDTLKGAENLGEVDDVKYFRDKLLAALKIPKDYIVEKDQSPERKANLSQLDVKFGKVITRIQSEVEKGLELIAKRHLMLKKFPMENIKKLKIKLPAPSDMSRKRQLDLDEQKARVVQAVKGLGIFPIEYIYKEYYQFNATEIEKIKKILQKEQKDPVLMAMAQGGMGGMPGAPMPGAPMPGMEGAPPGGGMAEPAENEAPTANESIDNILLNGSISTEARMVLLELKEGKTHFIENGLGRKSK